MLKKITKWETEDGKVFDTQEEAEDFVFEQESQIAAQQAVQAAVPEAIEQMAVDRYKVVPSHESMFHRFAVVAGNGTQQLYIGREVECLNMARKFVGAFLDGAFVAMQNTTPAHTAEGVLAQRIAALAATQPATAEPVELPEPTVWMISGSHMTWKGEFAEYGAKAEASRCGGSCTAFALYTEQQVMDILKSAGGPVKQR